MYLNTIATIPALHDLRRLSADSNDDLMLMACNIPHPQHPSPTNRPLQPQLLPLSHAGEQNELSSFGSLQSDFSQIPVTGKLAGCLLHPLAVKLQTAVVVLGFLSVCSVVAKTHLCYSFNSDSYYLSGLDSVCLAGRRVLVSHLARL